MLSHSVKTCLLILMLAFSKNLYADYNITVNIDGKEYYSDANGSANKDVVSIENDGSISISRKRARAMSTANAAQNSNYGAKRKGKRKYEHLVAEAADKHQVDPKLVHAVIQAESAYNEKAVSSAGAAGLMQLMPGTARQYGVSDRFDPYQNIEGGTRYLKHLMELFGSNLDLTLAAYNAGENAVIKHHYHIPPYAETRHYVKEVLSLQKGKLQRSKKFTISSNPFVSWRDSDFNSESDYP